MEINPLVLDEMFRLANIKKCVLYEALCIQGPEGVRGRYKKEWCEENPTRGYCFVVTHFVGKLLEDGDLPGGPRVVPYELERRIPGEHESHWFLKWDDQLVDLTAEQFGKDYSTKLPPGSYCEGKPRRWRKNPHVLQLVDDYRRVRDGL